MRFEKKCGIIKRRGSLAQLVEQRPEEPCVPSSSLGGATKIILKIDFVRGRFLFWAEIGEDFLKKVRKGLAFCDFLRYNGRVFGYATLAQLVRAAVL